MYSVSGGAFKHSLPCIFHIHHAVLITIDEHHPRSACQRRHCHGALSPKAELYLTTFMTLVINNYFNLWESISVLRELGCVLKVVRNSRVAE